MPPSGGATNDENYSPPSEGCRGGLWRIGRPTPKADAFSPPRRDFQRRFERYGNKEGISRGFS